MAPLNYVAPGHRHVAAGADLTFGHEGTTPMDALELVAVTGAAIHDVPAAFMLDPATYAATSEIGYFGADFYFVGRAGVLGDVPGEVAAAAMVFFAPDAVVASFRRSGALQPRAEAARTFAECGHRWAREKLSGEATATVAELAGKVVAAAPVAGAPLFAGWRNLEVPTDAPAAAHHQLNALRELRGALHGAAVLAVGLTPREALAMEHPTMAPIHGFHDEFTVDEARRHLLARAHEATDAMVAPLLGVLDGTEAEAFAAACVELRSQL